MHSYPWGVYPTVWTNQEEGALQPSFVLRFDQMRAVADMLYDLADEMQDQWNKLSDEEKQAEQARIEKLVEERENKNNG